MDEIMDFMDTNMITLVSNDKHEFTIDVALCNYSKYLHNIIENDVSYNTININCSKEFLDIILQFLKYYSSNIYDDIHSPLPKNFHNLLFINNKEKKTFKDDFYTKLLDIFDKNNMDKFYDFIYIVNYLGISPLLILASARIASFIKE